MKATKRQRVGSKRSSGTRRSECAEILGGFEKVLDGMYRKAMRKAKRRGIRVSSVTIPKGTIQYKVAVIAALHNEDQKL